MGKRKRGQQDGAGVAPPVKSRKAQQGTSKPENQSKPKASDTTADAELDQGLLNVERAWSKTTVTIQVVTGSYERVLHGFTASIPQDAITGPLSKKAKATSNGRKTEDTTNGEGSKVGFSDTFLFNAHASAIRCLALSPPTSNPNGHIMLATGSTDERINIYNVSQRPIRVSDKAKLQLPSLHNNTITENRKNTLIGTLLNHSSSISALYFPTRAKLITAAEDSTISIVRNRDWVPLDTIKVPIPKVQGRPSGDTAGPGEVPSGVNDFAVHPSMKLMLSVGKGEKCMRLWNLVTGKKAGVLTFGREVLASAGESRFGTGEGRRVAWDEEGEEFVVAFERGAVVYGIDCKPRFSIMPTPRTKIHQLHYLQIPTSENDKTNVLAVSTEDGRIMFYDTSKPSLKANDSQILTEKGDESPQPCALIAQLGGPAAGITGRVKEFELLPIPNAMEARKSPRGFLIVSGSSDGSVRLWLVKTADLQAAHRKMQGGGEAKEASNTYTSAQVGEMLATYTTDSRITCLKAFVMTGEPEEFENVAPKPQNGKIRADGDDDSSDSNDDDAAAGAEEEEDEEDFEGFGEDDDDE